MKPRSYLKRLKRINLTPDNIINIFLPKEYINNTDYINLCSTLMINSLAKCKCDYIKKALTPIELLTLSADFEYIDITKCISCEIRKLISNNLTADNIPIELFLGFMREFLLLQKIRKYCSCSKYHDINCKICDLIISYNRISKKDQL